MRMLLADVDPLAQGHRGLWRAASRLAQCVQSGTQILCAPHGQTLGAWPRWTQRAAISKHLQTLRTSTQQTPVQRDAAQVLIRRPARIRQSFALADGKTCLLGGFRITPAPSVMLAAAITDDDFAGALHAHFAACWNAGLEAGGRSLADPAEPIRMDRLPQTRPDLRLLRSFAVPRQGLFRTTPEPRVTDLLDAMLKLIAEATSEIHMETNGLTNARLVSALQDAARANPGLRLDIHEPHDRLGVPVTYAGQTGPGQRDAHRAAITALRGAFGDRIRLDTRRAQTFGTVLVVDRAKTLITSAEHDEPCLLWNTEAGVLIDDPGFAGEVLAQLTAG